MPAHNDQFPALTSTDGLMKSMVPLVAMKAAGVVALSILDIENHPWESSTVSAQQGRKTRVRGR